MTKENSSDDLPSALSWIVIMALLVLMTYGVIIAVSYALLKRLVFGVVFGVWL